MHAGAVLQAKYERRRERHGYDNGDDHEDLDPDGSLTWLSPVRAALCHRSHREGDSMSLSRHTVSFASILADMPRLWTDTIDTHRHAVREAALDSAAAILREHGLRGVTMAQIAEEAGVGRATLYKYFPDVEAILVAWHQRQMRRHLDLLASVAQQAGDPAERLVAVLTAYARLSSQFGAHHDEPLVDLLHRDQQVADAERELRAMLKRLIRQAAASGAARSDVPPGELAEYCLHALGASRSAPSMAAIRRLVGVTVDGLRRAGRRRADCG